MSKFCARQIPTTAVGREPRADDTATVGTHPGLRPPLSRGDEDHFSRPADVHICRAYAMGGRVSGHTHASGMSKTRHNGTEVNPSAASLRGVPRDAERRGNLILQATQRIEIATARKAYLAMTAPWDYQQAACGGFPVIPASGGSDD
ncbi:MAG: hypothetical protein OEV68_14595 [candidate division Zixibacteria bacterium]|nr:hypothetical protein [candidate division Zixibacteria bacterium]